MSELDELREQYRLLAETSLPLSVKGRVEEMIAAHQDERGALHHGEPVDAGPVAQSVRFRRYQHWVSRIPLTRRSVTSVTAGFVALVAACSVVIGVITHHTVSPVAAVTTTAGGHPVISSSSQWPADPSYMPVMIGIWAALGVVFVVSAWTAVLAFWKKRAWVLGAVAGCIAVACALEGVDQWQGGPLGRANPYFGGQPNFGGPLAMGQTNLLVEGEIVNPTILPFEVLSVEPMNHPAGLTLQAGFLRKGFGGGSLPPTSAGSNVFNDGRVVKIPNDLIRLPLTVAAQVPSRYANVGPVLLITRTGPGPQIVRGVSIIYRWGPMLYRARFTNFAVAEYWPHQVPPNLP